MNEWLNEYNDLTTLDCQLERIQYTHALIDANIVVYWFTERLHPIFAEIK